MSHAQPENESSSERQRHWSHIPPLAYLRIRALCSFRPDALVDIASTCPETERCRFTARTSFPVALQQIAVHKARHGWHKAKGRLAAVDVEAALGVLAEHIDAKAGAARASRSRASSVQSTRRCSGAARASPTSAFRPWRTERRRRCVKLPRSKHTTLTTLRSHNNASQMQSNCWKRRIWRMHCVSLLGLRFKLATRCCATRRRWRRRLRRNLRFGASSECARSICEMPICDIALPMRVRWWMIDAQALYVVAATNDSKSVQSVGSDLF